MGGGAYGWLTPAGMIAAASAHNPDYGKMAAESIAKEVDERKLVLRTDQAAPTTGTDQTKPAADPTPGNALKA